MRGNNPVSITTLLPFVTTLFPNGRRDSWRNMGHLAEDMECLVEELDWCFKKKASFHPFLPLIPKISINFGIRIFCRTIASSFLPSPKGANRSNTGCGSPLCTHEHEYLCPGTWATMPGNTGAFNRQSRLKVPRAPGKVGQCGLTILVDHFLSYL